MILAVYNIDIENLGNIKRLLPYKVKEVLAEEIKGDENFDSLIIMGGPQSVYEIEKYPYLKKEIELIKKALLNDKRVLGVCLGAQLISYALGGEVSKGSFGPEIGVSKISLLSDFIKVFKSHEIFVFQLHHDTFTLPTGSELLAYSSKYYQAFKYKRMLAVQFHLEVNNELIEEWAKKYNLSQDIVKQVSEIEDILTENLEKLINYWFLL
ncbi:MAG: type 1 glutamine amidotransferase [Sulfolobaceae archaeon]